MNGRRSSPVLPLENLPPVDMHQHRPAVLVVDDESAIADTVTEILSRSGYAATAAYDGNDALETALLSPPELLITDVVLPGMSGIELAITVKRIFPDCKILLFSGQAATADLMANARNAGHHFTLLSKPVHPRDLLTSVAAMLKPREARLSPVSS